LYPESSWFECLSDFGDNLPAYRDDGAVKWSHQVLHYAITFTSATPTWFGCPAPDAVNITLDRWGSLVWHHYLLWQDHGYSQGTQDAILMQVFAAIGTTNKYFVEFGARRPDTLNTAFFRKNCDWCGLLIDGEVPNGDEGEETKEIDREARHNLAMAPSDACVKLRISMITAENINDIFERAEVPRTFDLLTVDIDRNDYYVLEAIDIQRFRPRVVAVEFSPFFMANESCVVPYDANAIFRDGPGDLSGASLAMLSHLMNEKGYRFVTTAFEHGIFAHASVLPGTGLGSQIPNRTPYSFQWAARRFIDFGREALRII